MTGWEGVQGGFIGDRGMGFMGGFIGDREEGDHGWVYR